MKLTSTIKERQFNQELKYPCLMRVRDYPENIVLLYSKNKGVVVACGEDKRWGVGFHSFNWGQPSDFEPYYGSVTITQE